MRLLKAHLNDGSDFVVVVSVTRHSPRGLNWIIFRNFIALARFRGSVGG